MYLARTSSLPRVRRDGDIKSLRIDGSKLLKELGELPNSKIEDIFKH
jgi:hypothetical protein